VNKEITDLEEGDELEGDDVAQTIADILTKLDAGAEQFASEAQERPNYVYNLTGKLCSQLHLLKETNDLLHQSNTRNKTMRDRIAAQYSESQAAKSMPAELELLLSIQEVPLSASLFLTEVQLHHIQGSRAQSLNLIR
jgi:hypothetical protein